MKRFLLLISTIAALSSCTYDKGETAAITIPTNCDTTTAITYTGSIKAIISDNCNLPTCHAQGGAGTGYFDNFSDLKASIDNHTFQDDVFSNNPSMPKPISPYKGPLSACDLVKLKIWIRQGYLNN